MKKFILPILLIFTITIYSQDELGRKLSGEYNPLELVSITQYASFDQAVKMLSAVSELISGKSIVSTISSPAPIGVEIKKMPYMDALNLIVNARNLMYEEKEGSIVIKTKEVTKEETLKDDVYADVDAREVRISALFFEADVEKTREMGIDWTTLLSKSGVSVGADFSTQTIPSANQAQFNKPLHHMGILIQI